MVLTAITAPGWPALQAQLTHEFLALTGVAALLTLLLYSEQPRLSRRAIVAMLPWMIVGAGLSLLTASHPYPPLIRPAITGAGAYVTTYAVVVLVWFAILQFTRGTADEGGYPTHLGAMGTGTALVVLGAVLLTSGSISGYHVFWLAVTPIAAAAVAGVVLILLGLWYTEAAAYTGIVGGLVVFGHAFSAIATTVAIVGESGGHSVWSWAVLNLAGAVRSTGLVNLDLQLLWVWGFVSTKLLVATLVLVVMATYTHRHPERGNLVLGAVGGVGVISGTTALLGMVVG